MNIYRTHIQLKKTLTKDTIMNSLLKMTDGKYFTFRNWLVNNFKLSISKRYYTCLICQTEINETQTLYEINP